MWTLNAEWLKSFWSADMVDKASSIKRNCEFTIHHLVCKFCMQNGLKMTQQTRDAFEIHKVSKMTADAEHYLRPKALEEGLRNRLSPPWAGESWDLRRGRWEGREKRSHSHLSCISLIHKSHPNRKGTRRETFPRTKSWASCIYFSLSPLHPLQYVTCRHSGFCLFPWFPSM